jgi:amino acid adenylation domain-containing protein
MQGIWSFLLHRYTGSKDITYGVIVSGRPDEMNSVEQRVGLFINTLPLHSIINNDVIISDWLKDMQNQRVHTRQFQYTPLQEIQEWTEVSGDLFDSLLVFENYPVSEITKSRNWKLEVDNVQMKEQTNYPLTIIISDEEEIKIRFSYNKELLSDENVKKIRDHFENVLMQVIGDDGLVYDKIEILTNSEKQQLVSEFNDIEVGYPKDKTMLDLLEEQVQKTPENIALVFENKTLTYKELNEKSNRLAYYLKSKGVKEESLVPICIERSFEMIVGILGILKAGGAYVPIDPDYPEERIRYIIEDTAAKIILTDKESKSKLTAFENIEIIEIDGVQTEIDKQSTDILKTSVKPDNVAYIIYTSGSTGNPKGVMVTHSNVVRLFKNDSPLFDFNENDVWTMFHSFCFDFSVWEMYGALFFGGKVVIVPKSVTKDSTLFSELLEKEKVTILNQIPSSFYVLQESLSENKKDLNVRYVIFGGEALDPAKLKFWKQNYPDCKLINMYGITETTVHVTYQEIEQKHIESGNSIIGKPIPTLGIHILDKDQKLLPVGVAGELCISGAGLARGYLNRHELTSEKFIKDPFSNESNARLYRSGDLGKRLPDGNIEYLGRIDEQVKIRGYRIELGEIESALNECESVTQAIVLAKTDPENNKKLVAYIVSEGLFNREKILSYLKSKLPEYMIPVQLIEMESFPLTSSGKINKKALPEPDASVLTGNEFIAPVTDAEIKIAEIWKEVLNIERVGINDNFFELGGDSIKVIRVVNKLRKEFKKEIKVFDIYDSGTLSGLIPIIENYTPANSNYNDKLKETESEFEIIKNSLLPFLPDRDNIEDIFPMSDIQSGMVYASLLDPEQAIYHDQFVYKLSGKIEGKVFEKALHLMTEKHSILRTAFNMDIYTEGVQIVYKSVKVVPEHIELFKAADEEAVSFIKTYFRNERAKPFEISKAPLWRASLVYLK